MRFSPVRNRMLGSHKDSPSSKMLDPLRTTSAARSALPVMARPTLMVKPNIFPSLQHNAAVAHGSVSDELLRQLVTSHP